MRREQKYTALLRSLLNDFVLQLSDEWFDQPESPKYALHGLHSIKACLLNIVAAHEQLGARFKQVSSLLRLYWLRVLSLWLEQAILYETGEAGQTVHIWDDLDKIVDQLYETYFSWFFVMQVSIQLKCHCPCHALSCSWNGAC